VGRKDLRSSGIASAPLLQLEAQGDPSGSRAANGGAALAVRVKADRAPTVCWRAGLLPPPDGERARVDPVEAKRVDQAQHQRFGARIVPATVVSP
jgi:hypothetical protein